MQCVETELGMIFWIFPGYFYFEVALLSNLAVEGENRAEKEIDEHLVEKSEVK